MGRQINFYMSEGIQINFLKYLEQNKFIFLDNKAKIISQPFSRNIFDLYLYKKDYGSIIMCQDIMDCIKSPVIEFNKTTIKEEYKKVLRGRLWVLERYYDDEGEVVKKEDLLIKDYQTLNRWVKKHVPYQEIKKGEFFVKEYVNDELKELQDKGFALTL